MCRQMHCSNRIFSFTFAQSILINRLIKENAFHLVEHNLKYESFLSSNQIMKKIYTQSKVTKKMFFLQDIPLKSALIILESPLIIIISNLGYLYNSQGSSGARVHTPPRYLSLENCIIVSIITFNIYIACTRTFNYLQW